MAADSDGNTSHYFYWTESPMRALKAIPPPILILSCGEALFGPIRVTAYAKLCSYTTTGAAGELEKHVNRRIRRRRCMCLEFSSIEIRKER